MFKHPPEDAGNTEAEDALSAAQSPVQAMLPSQDTKAKSPPRGFHAQVAQGLNEISVLIRFDAALYEQVFCSVCANSVALFGLTGSEPSGARRSPLELLDILRFDTPIDPLLTTSILTESSLVLSLTKLPWGQA